MAHECTMRLGLFILVLFVGRCYGSSQINDTTFANLPPLYGLEQWARCQEEGDVYCIVDAALVADAPSPILDLLKEYSSNKQQHFNRTLVHRGVCVSRWGAPQESPRAWHAAAARALDHELADYGLQAEVLSVDWCQRAGPAQPSASARALAIVVLVLLALVVLATALHVLGDRCANTDGNKYLLAFSLKRNWEILTYDRSKPRTDQRMKDLTSMEGVRVLGIQSVILSHVTILSTYSYTNNPQFIERNTDNIGWQLAQNSPSWLQAFFAMSGFLLTYSTLITVDKSPFTVFKCFMAVLNRYIRLTPAAGIALWFTISWYPLLSSGPQWGWLVVRESQDCAERWWYHIIYTHNHLKMGKMCMGHTWYLAADMQLHVVGLAALLLLVRWRRAAAPLLAVMFAGSAVASGVVAYVYQTKTLGTSQSPEMLRTLFADSLALTLQYMPCWMNLAGYAAGMATAFLLHRVQRDGLKLNQNKWFGAAFHASLAAGGGVAALGALFVREPAPPLWADALYSALVRPLIALCFCVFLLGCFTRCKSAVRNMLEWRGFHFLGRVSYSVFLVHFTLLRLVVGGDTQLRQLSGYSMINLAISVTVLSYAVAIPYCLLFELPPLQLWKACTERGDKRDRRDRQEQEATPQAPPAVKPLDLVANIRRRQDV